MIKEIHCPYDSNIVIRKWIPDPPPKVEAPTEQPLINQQTEEENQEDEGEL
jgi:hypothetical protein